MDKKTHKNIIKLVHATFSKYCHISKLRVSNNRNLILSDLTQ